MAFDSSVLRGVLAEIEEHLAGKRVRSIRLSRDGFFLEFSGGVGILVNLSRLLFSIFLSESSLEAVEQTDPPFILLLRKHLLGSELIRVYQHEFDRIAFLEFETRYSSRLIERKKLVLELFPAESNALLIGDERLVISSWRKRRAGGNFYAPSSLRRENPLLLRSIEEFSIDRISDIFQGMSRNLLDYLSSGNLPERWKSWINALEKRNFSPVLFEGEDGAPLDYWLLDYDPRGSGVKKFYSSLSELIEKFIRRKIKFEERLALEKRKEKERKDRLKYLLKKREKLLSAIAREKEAERLRILAETILANISSICKGEREAKLLNPYTGEMELISLDPSLSPSENARRLFKEASRLRRGAKKAALELENVEREIKKLESLKGPGEVPMEEKGEKKGQIFASPFREFDYKGWKILVGKGAESNDLLTFKKASPDDIWLHVQGSPGSHVVIRCSSGSEVPNDVLEYAASLAAYYSKARMNTKVPVDYTLVRYVKRHPSGRRGAVLIRNQKTIWVRPRSGEIS